MNLCACGKGCSDVISLIKCKNGTQSTSMGANLSIIAENVVSKGSWKFSNNQESVIRGSLSSPADDARMCHSQSMSDLSNNIQSIPESPVVLTSDSYGSYLTSDQSIRLGNNFEANYLTDTSNPQKTSASSDLIKSTSFESLLSPHWHRHNLSLRVKSAEKDGSSAVTVNVSTDLGKTGSSDRILTKSKNADKANLHEWSSRSLLPSAVSPNPKSNVRECDSSSGSEAFENLLAQLKRAESTKQVQSKGHSDFSFVVSDHSSSSDSGSNDGLTFYRQIDNANLMESTKQTMPMTDILRFDSSSDRSSDEVEEFYSHEASESEESDQLSETPPSVDYIRKNRPFKTNKTTHLKAINNVQQEISTLPFIYSLSPLDPKPQQTTVYKRHPSAERFLKKFKKNREELANRLLAYFNEAVFDNQLPGELKVTWNERLLKTAGQCVYLKRSTKRPDGSIASKCEVRIELSGKVCTSAERVRDTLLHEACHAAVWLAHGVNDHHGRLWRGLVDKANAAFPGLPPITVRHTYAIDSRFIYRCTGCFYTIKRHSKSLDIQKKVCGRCRSKFELFVSKNGKLVPVHRPGESQTTTVEMTPRSRPVFAEFVKENYRQVRGVASTHKDAMTQLGALFRSMKLNSDKDKDH